MAKSGKRLKKAYEGIDRNAAYEVDEAVKLVKQGCTSKFDETVEIAMNLGVDPRHADQNVRGVVNLPNGTGKTVRVAVFAKGPKAEEASEAGADMVGADDLAAKIQGGEIDFDRCIATPDMMPVVGKLGKILGPRGLMPNPKLGTVTNDVDRGGQAAKGGQVEFRAEKAGIVHAGVGKASLPRVRWSRMSGPSSTRSTAPSPAAQRAPTSRRCRSARPWAGRESGCREPFDAGLRPRLREVSPRESGSRPRSARTYEAAAGAVADPNLSETAGVPDRKGSGPKPSGGLHRQEA